MKYDWYQRTGRRWIRNGFDGAFCLFILCLSVWGLPLKAESLSAPQALSQLPLADPVIDSNAQLQAQRTTVWKVDGVQYMLLEKDVRISVGSYGFRAHQAVIRLQQEIRRTRKIHHIWMYLQDIKPWMGHGLTQAQASHLLVTVSTTGKLELATDLFQRTSRQADPLVQTALQRFTSRLAIISRKPLDIPTGAPIDVAAARKLKQRMAKPTVIRPSAPATSSNVSQPPQAQTSDMGKEKPEPNGQGTTSAHPSVAVSGLEGSREPGRTPAIGAQTSGGRILPPVGTVHLTFDRMVVDLNPKAPHAVLIGKVGIMFVNRQGKVAMSLRADQAVLFLSPHDAHEQVFNRTKASSVTGVYLEDHVIATDGNYTLRSSRVYYDNRLNKATLLDAVMYAWDVKNQVPIYVRAKTLEQLSKNNWRAGQARLTTSEFAEPHFSIATRSLTLTRKKDNKGKTQYRYVAEHPAVQWGHTTVFAGSRLTGSSHDLPLQKADINFSENRGVNLRTKWNLFSLLGRDRPEGVKMSLNADYRGTHGPAVGIDLNYNKPDMFGTFKAYGLLRDSGDDNIGGRESVGHDNDIRGYIHSQHRSYLQDGWELSLELAYVSDETFLEEFFRSEAQSVKPYETSLYLKRQQDDWAMTFLGKTDLNNFTSQTSVLQAPGYTVDKLPELGFYKIGSSLWHDRLTYYSQTTASRMRIQVGQDNPQDRGFTEAQSRLLFGQSRSVGFDQALAARGIPTDYVLRLDSRHEIQAPMKFKTIDVVPFAIGRFTAYDDDFKQFGGNRKNMRLWGSMGIRAHTQFHKKLGEIDSRLFDLHQLQHLVEPRVEISLAGTSLNAQKLPTYDFDVEPLRDGMTLKLGVRNTLQTQRGGPGRWRSVDWITLDTEVVTSSGEVNSTPSVLGHFFGYRPEFSQGQDYFHSNLAWMISDSLAASGDLTYDFNQNKTTQWRLGLSMQHAPRLTSFVDFSELDTLNSRLLSLGFTYQLTRKYSMSLANRFDFSQDNQRFVDVTLIRELPRWRMIFLYSLDEVNGDQTTGILLTPMGVGGSNTRSIFHSALR